MSIHPPQRIAELVVEAGVRKASLPASALAVLGFLGGAFVAFGFLLDIRVTGNLPREWGSLAGFLGASVFPLGVILIVIGGGELITGNFMILPMAASSRRISIARMMNNWIWVTIMNFIGAVTVAYLFGHVVGLTETGPFLTKTVEFAQVKLDDNFLQSFVSGIGCNWLVCMAIWLSFSAQSVGGKVIGIWFPIMAFVSIGFQNLVANMFVIPAAIFAGHFTWLDCLHNFVPVFLGNLVGGALFVAAGYYWVFVKKREG